MENMIEGSKSKKVRKGKKEKKEYRLKEDQTKFFVDLSGDKNNLEMIFNILKKCNEKSYGREILFKDVSLFSLGKLNDKDFEKIQEGSLTEMEKVQRALDEYNKKSGTNISLGEYLVKKLGIN